MALWEITVTRASAVVIPLLVPKSLRFIRLRRGQLIPQTLHNVSVARLPGPLEPLGRLLPPWA